MGLFNHRSVFTRAICHSLIYFIFLSLLPWDPATADNDRNDRGESSESSDSAGGTDKPKDADEPLREALGINFPANSETGAPYAASAVDPQENEESAELSNVPERTPHFLSWPTQRFVETNRSGESRVHTSTERPGYTSPVQWRITQSEDLELSIQEIDGVSTVVLAYKPANTRDKHYGSRVEQTGFDETPFVAVGQDENLGFVLDADGNLFIIDLAMTRREFGRRDMVMHPAAKVDVRPGAKLSLKVFRGAYMLKDFRFASKLLENDAQAILELGALMIVEEVPGQTPTIIDVRSRAQLLTAMFSSQFHWSAEVARQKGHNLTDLVAIVQGLGETVDLSQSLMESNPELFSETNWDETIARLRSFSPRWALDSVKSGMVQMMDAIQESARANQDRESIGHWLGSGNLRLSRETAEVLADVFNIREGSDTAAKRVTDRWSPQQIAIAFMEFRDAAEVYVKDNFLDPRAAVLGKIIERLGAVEFINTNRAAISLVKQVRRSALKGDAAKLQLAQLMATVSYLNDPDHASYAESLLKNSSHPVKSFIVQLSKQAWAQKLNHFRKTYIMNVPHAILIGTFGLVASAYAQANLGIETMVGRFVENTANHMMTPEQSSWTLSALGAGILAYFGVRVLLAVTAKIKGKGETEATVMQYYGSRLYGVTLCQPLGCLAAKATGQENFVEAARRGHLPIWTGHGALHRPAYLAGGEESANEARQTLLTHANEVEARYGAVREAAFRHAILTTAALRGQALEADANMSLEDLLKAYRELISRTIANSNTQIQSMLDHVQATDPDRLGEVMGTVTMLGVQRERDLKELTSTIRDLADLYTAQLLKHAKREQLDFSNRAFSSSAARSLEDRASELADDTYAALKSKGKLGTAMKLRARLSRTKSAIAKFVPELFVYPLQVQESIRLARVKRAVADSNFAGWVGDIPTVIALPVVWQGWPLQFVSEFALGERFPTRADPNFPSELYGQEHGVFHLHNVEAMSQVKNHWAYGTEQQAMTIAEQEPDKSVAHPYARDGRQVPELERQQPWYRAPGSFLKAVFSWREAHYPLYARGKFKNYIMLSQPMLITYFTAAVLIGGQDPVDAFFQFIAFNGLAAWWYRWVWMSIYVGGPHQDKVLKRSYSKFTNARDRFERAMNLRDYNSARAHAVELKLIYDSNNVDFEPARNWAGKSPDQISESELAEVKSFIRSTPGAWNGKNTHVEESIVTFYGGLLTTALGTTMMIFLTTKIFGKMALSAWAQYQGLDPATVLQDDPNTMDPIDIWDRGMLTSIGVFGLLGYLGFAKAIETADSILKFYRSRFLGNVWRSIPLVGGFDVAFLTHTWDELRYQRRGRAEARRLRAPSAFATDLEAELRKDHSRRMREISRMPESQRHGAADRERARFQSELAKIYSPLNYDLETPRRLQRALEDQRQRINLNTQLTPEQRSAQLAAAEASYRESMEAYRQQREAFTAQNLNRRNSMRGRIAYTCDRVLGKIPPLGRLFSAPKPQFLR